MTSAQPLPAVTVAAHRFLDAVKHQYAVRDAYLFGSQAHGDARADSDADIAVLLRGTHGVRVDAALKMADIAFDVMLETGVLVEAIPLWEGEWEHPETFNNPPCWRISAAMEYGSSRHLIV